jgi:type IV fimbrial biogenesis protein FimT
MKIPKKRSHGFTLVEIMVTLTIAAILLTVAVPSFNAYQRNSELTSATNSILAAINSARGEAMKIGSKAIMVPAGSATDWSTGWIIFVDKDAGRNQTYDAGVDQVILRGDALPSYLTLAGDGSSTVSQNPAYLLFDPSGFPKDRTGGFSNSTLTLARNDLTGASLLEQTRRIVVSQTGRVRTCKPLSATDANCRPGRGS